MGEMPWNILPKFIFHCQVLQSLWLLFTEVFCLFASYPSDRFVSDIGARQQATQRNQIDGYEVDGINTHFNSVTKPRFVDCRFGYSNIGLQNKLLFLLEGVNRRS